jgi:Transport and Golgi organisation 2
MCTVTFVPVKDTFIITSNRDEKHTRAKALPPIKYNVNGVNIIFPKDATAGGTWIAVTENGNAAVVLNGGFVNHISAPPYRKSRGIVLLDIIADDEPVNCFSKTDLNNIEPFTIIILQSNDLFECRWDGTKKHSKELYNQFPYIWSSATLYDEVTVQKREQWFACFLSNYYNPSQENILHFHQFTGDGDLQNDLKMDRNGRMSTVSVTSIVIENNKAIMKYADLKDNKEHQQQIHFTTSLQEA